MRFYSKTYKTFQFFNYTCIALLSLACILPLIHILAVSFSSRDAATANIVNFIPIDFTTAAYKETLGNNNFIRALLIGVQRTVLGTVLSLIVTMMAAYSLSKEQHRFRGRNIYSWYFIIIMLFHGGLIPTYLVVSGTGLMDSIWALVIPSAVNVWNMILMLNFFRNLPQELEEAALMDGAGHFRTLFSIFIPVSMPSVATIMLFTMVVHWNSWFDGILYMTKVEDYPLASFLHTIVVKENFSEVGVDLAALHQISNRTVKSSQIFIGALPILLVYPFLQKYFVKGIVLGSVKG
ncbi:MULTISPECIES: carbohydrate ABC transporter permease [Paenibacillus]|uniref:ABC transporter permease subunit n=1 Tax=Paenibacillus campinasensis TaxID=66347 RepID=A0ABW9SVS0_9BACL|nr:MULTISPECIES: carbohydrate ABC transporter permease [Paenibacillus]MUG64762.1 ABC transporter permease subunit [Paenibacillus campinasensis]PAK55472.1 ABC transporter permease [Paenibacillus sp. 7541]